MKKTEPEILDYSYFLSQFNKESDRGAVLTAGAYLEEKLGDIILAFLIDNKISRELLSGINSPLGTFSARIQASYALGLILENEYNELIIIKKIRNEFAHNWKNVSFNSSKVIDLCNNLPWLGPREYENKADSKGRFTMVVAILLADFLWRERLVKKEKRPLKNWSNRIRTFENNNDGVEFENY